MRILFLDIDGVIHPGPNVASMLTHFCWLPQLAQLLGPWADVQLVIHSSWRHQYEVAELREMLSSVRSRLHDVTTGAGRWESIRHWLSRNPRVTDFRILDDEPNEFPRPLPEELVICHPHSGITAPEVQVQLRRWLQA